VPIQEHDSFGIVQDDLRQGLGHIFETETDDAVRVTDDLREEETIGNGTIFAVPWVYEGRHVGDFQGLYPTGRMLRIEGVTLVDQRGGETLLRRYVDWASVIGQLGLHVSWRIPVTEEEYRRTD
jgi:hypothetical protein